MMDRDALIAAMREAATAAAIPRAVTVPQWGTVYVRKVTVAEVDGQTDDGEEQSKRHRIARGACRVLCDETGKRLFDASNADDVELLANQPWELMQAALTAAESPAKNE